MPGACVRGRNGRKRRGPRDRLGGVERLGTTGFGSAETHVKDFMIRHQGMQGLGVEDVERLQRLKDIGLYRRAYG